jgi:F-type H+-transporting ATPase subunit epsilon
MATVRLEIITAERVLFDSEVDAVVAPGAEGELGILPNHAALMTMLLPGELRYRISNEESYLAIMGGFMEVVSNRVTVLADAAEWAEEIDEARAQEGVRRAQERVAQQGEEIDLERALHSLRRAQVRIQTVTRRLRRRDQVGMTPLAGAP